MRMVCKAVTGRAVIAGFVAFLSVAATSSFARDFVDAAGRTVVVPDAVHRVFPAGPPADLLLFSIAPEMLVGLVKPWSAAQKPYVPEAYRELGPVPRAAARDLSHADLDKIRALKPDIIVDYGDVTPDYAAIADKIQAATGIPYVVLNGNLAVTSDSVRELGGLIDRRERAEEVARFADDTLVRVSNALSGLGANEHVRLYYARGEDGLQAVRPNNVNGEVPDLAGAVSVVREGSRTFAKLGIDEVRALAPSVVVLADGKAGQPGSPLRQALPAATFLVDPGIPFGWLESPPSLNRLVGLIWLAARLHPDRVQASPSDLQNAWHLLFGMTVPIEELGKAMQTSSK